MERFNARVSGVSYILALLLIGTVVLYPVATGRVSDETLPPWTPEPTDSAEPDADAPRAGLTPQELALLQLLASGYSPARLAALWGVALVDVLWRLQRPLTLLGAATAHEALAAARRRRLIV